MNNLRQIYAAAQQYMADNHVTSCTYTDIVGPGSEHPLHAITPIAGEDYTNLTLAQTMTQLTISSTALGTVTYPP